MNQAYYVTFTALFLAAAPLLMAIRCASPKRMPWWLLTVLAALFGWVFANLAVHFYYAHLNDLLAEAGDINETPQELIDRWQHDGAKRVFAYVFGWLYGLIYLVLWLLVYFLGAAARKAMSTRNNTGA